MQTYKLPSSAKILLHLPVLSPGRRAHRGPLAYQGAAARWHTRALRHGGQLAMGNAAGGPYLFVWMGVKHDGARTAQRSADQRSTRLRSG